MKENLKNKEEFVMTSKQIVNKMEGEKLNVGEISKNLGENERQLEKIEKKIKK